MAASPKKSTGASKKATSKAKSTSVSVANKSNNRYALYALIAVGIAVVGYFGYNMVSGNDSEAASYTYLYKTRHAKVYACKTSVNGGGLGRLYKVTVKVQENGLSVPRENLYIEAIGTNQRASANSRDYANGLNVKRTIYLSKVNQDRLKVRTQQTGVGHSKFKTYNIGQVGNFRNC